MAMHCWSQQPPRQVIADRGCTAPLGCAESNPWQGRGSPCHEDPSCPGPAPPVIPHMVWCPTRLKNSRGAPGKSTGPLGCPTVSPAGALPWLPWAHQTPLVPPCLLQASQLNVKPPTPCCAPCSCNEILHVGQVTAWQPERVRQWDGGGCIARCQACHDRSKSTAQIGRPAIGSPSNMGPPPPCPHAKGRL